MTKGILMSKFENDRIRIALPGGELQKTVLNVVQKSGLEFTAVGNDKRYLHAGKQCTC